MSEWPIEDIPLSAILPHPDNAFNHPDRQQEAIAASFWELGDVGVGIWNRRSGHLVDGHARLALKRTQGAQTMTCRVVDWDEKTEKKALLIINPVAQLAERNEDKMLELLKELDREDDYLLSLLYQDAEVQEMEARKLVQFMAAEKENQPRQGGDEYLENRTLADVPTRSLLGEVWCLGRHRLLVGDCTDPESLCRLFGESRAALCFTSPPYNAGDTQKLGDNLTMKQQESRYGQADLDKRSDWLELLRSFTCLAQDYCEYVFVNLQLLAGNKVDILNYLHRFQGYVADILVWDKTTTQPAMATNVMNSRFELVVMLDSQPDAKRAIRTADFRGTVDNVYQGLPQMHNEFSTEHAATMPLHLAEHILTQFTAKGDLVFDPFAGTGTTLIAGERLGRTVLMTEINPRFADLILSRWEAESGQTATLIEQEED